MNTHVQLLSKKLLTFFSFFFILNLSAQTTTSCAKYDVISTNNICGCVDIQFRPYGLFVESSDTCGITYFKPDTVVFELRNDSTAAIRGVFRTFNDWRPVRVDITMQKASTGTPRFDLCMSNSPVSVANQWRYFGAMSGTIQFDGGTPLSVSSRNGNFQLGFGANGQNTDFLGGSGFFTLSNGQRGGFGFTLTNPTTGTCVLSDSCVADATPPVIKNCPPNINLSTLGVSAVATWTPPTATDNCSTPSVSSNYTSGASFPIGTTTVIYTAKDIKNNSAECRFNVVVTLDPCATDAIPPVISNCPQNINFTTVGTSGVVTWTPPTVTDNCSTPTLTSNFVSGATFQIGTTTIIYTARDAKNNVSECRFNVIVSVLNPCAIDITPPTLINCPQNINLTTTGTRAVATWTPPTATDNCGTPTLTSNFTSGTSFPIGTTTISYIAADGRNNVSECRFTVTVTYVDPCLTDAVAPVISNCPQNISLTTSGTSAIATWTAPTATDNCSTPSVTGNFVSGASFPVGTTTVIYTVRDGRNNVSECRFTVTVTYVDPCLTDAVAPVISNCPQNISLTTSGTSAIATWTAPTATDNCSTPSVTSNFVSGASFPVGTTTVIYTVRDGRNNVSECRFTVTVTYVDPCLTDAVAPVISNCPQNISLTTSVTSAIATWTAPTATDNCSTPSVTSNFVSGASFPVGTTTVIYTVRDGRNNVSECRFTVTVTKRSGLAGVCTSYTVENTNDICGCPSRQWTPYGLFINTGGSCGDYYKADSVSFQINGDSSARLFGVFRTSTWRPVWLDIQWAKTNQQERRFSTCANDTAASRDWLFFGAAQGNIQFDDQHALSITNNSLLQFGISANGQNRDLLGASGLIVLGDGRVGSINIVLKNPISGTCDLACVNDSIAPRILNCPQNVTQLSSRPAVAIEWAAPSVRDACSSPTLSTTHKSGTLFPLGETTVIYTARDVSGNQSQCSFKVAINPVPVGSLCSSYIVRNTNDICGCAANQWKPYALRLGANNCGEYYQADSVVFNVKGDSTGLLQGRFRSDTWQPIHVNIQFAKGANRSPRFELCQNSNVDVAEWQYFGSMSGTIQIGSAPPVAISSSSSFQIGKGANGQNPSEMGGNVNFLLANGTSASFNMILTDYQQFICPEYNACAADITKPTVGNCPHDTTIVAAQAAEAVYWTNPTFADNCPLGLTITSNFASGHIFTAGTTMVTYTAKDAAGNTAACRFTITILPNPCFQDIVPPVLHNCPDSIVVVTDAVPAVATWTMPTATDNCSTPSVSSNFPSGMRFFRGKTLIKVEAQDIAGNKSQCYFNVIVYLVNGINDLNTTVSLIKVAPNPVSNQLNLEWQSRVDDDMQLEISNSLGQIVLKQKISTQVGLNNMPIDVSLLARGAYHLTLRNPRFATTKAVRFIKI